MTLLKGCFIAACMASLVLAGDETYVIEAKGKLGEELKTLLEKYAKDTNSTIVSYKKSDKSSSNDGFFSRIFSDEKMDFSFDIANGERLYNKKCKNCHGEKGNVRVFGSRQLSSMSADEIEMSFRQYASDGGGKNRYLMKPVSNSTSLKQLRDIIYYIKGGNSMPYSDKGDDEPRTQGVYLQ